MSQMESDASFQQILNSRMQDKSLTSDFEEEDLITQITNLSKINKKASRRLKAKKAELANVRESQQKHQEMLSQAIDQLESDNKTLEKELTKRMALVDKITKLFYQLVGEGADLTQYADIDFEELVNVCGMPPQNSTDEGEVTAAMRRNLDPIAIKITTRDPYFANVKDNDDFVDAVMKLVKEHQRCKSWKPRDVSSLVSKMQSLSVTSETKQHANEMKSQIVRESQKTMNEQKSFAREIQRLVAVKHDLINQINEEKRKIKERQESYKQQSSLPAGKTVIRLRMATPTKTSTRITDSAITESTELTFPSASKN